MARKLLRGYHPDPSAVERTVAFLNDGEFRVEQLKDSDREELRELMKEWLASEANWTRFRSRMLRLAAEKRKKGRRYKCKSFPYTGTFYVAAGETGDPILILSPSKGASHAQGVFLQFFLHPDQRLLVGPCARSGCGRYYIKTSRNKIYCSPSCASHISALVAMKKKRLELHKQQLDDAKSAIVKWERLRMQGDWKLWVESETGVTARTLTRWVAHGELRPPVDRGRRNAKG